MTVIDKKQPTDRLQDNLNQVQRLIERQRLVDPGQLRQRLHRLPAPDFGLQVDPARRRLALRLREVSHGRGGQGVPN